MLERHNKHRCSFFYRNENEGGYLPTRQPICSYVCSYMNVYKIETFSVGFIEEMECNTYITRSRTFIMITKFDCYPSISVIFQRKQCYNYLRKHVRKLFRKKNRFVIKFLATINMRRIGNFSCRLSN